MQPRRMRRKSAKRSIPVRVCDTDAVGTNELPNSLLNFARNFRDPQLNLVRDLWRMIDLDKDGKVTRRELSVVLNELGIDVCCVV
jgi:Ca2+-binding EF-hand superfamily protein